MSAAVDQRTCCGGAKCFCGRFKALFRANDMTSSSHVLRELIAEFMGSAILVLFGCGSAITLTDDKTASVVSIAIAYGLAVSTVIWCFDHVSGAQVNPGVSIAMFCTRKMSLLKTFLYCMVQCMGGTAGAGVLFGLTPEPDRGTLGVTRVSSKISPSQAFGVEFLATFVLVLAIFASYDRQRVDHEGSRSLSIGLVISMEVPWVFQYTGASMNPVRSLGPAIVMEMWDKHWVFWLGPILGAVVAGVLYDNLFAVNASITKTKSCITSTNYNNHSVNDTELVARHNTNPVVREPQRLRASDRTDRSEDCEC
ncbi:aquaporin-5-like [Gigantopelta aegis]|uniref:aquaporin-5-like n=1 Tax=Gigantopelta aegis TaxID=1735272 RepID=UPI001B88E60F|nr:aquaporin-5-like [Gigantopelta aegis]